MAEGGGLSKAFAVVAISSSGLSTPGWWRSQSSTAGSMSDAGVGWRARVLYRARKPQWVVSRMLYNTMIIKTYIVILNTVSSKKRRLIIVHPWCR